MSRLVLSSDVHGPDKSGATPARIRQTHRSACVSVCVNPPLTCFWLRISSRPPPTTVVSSSTRKIKQRNKKTQRPGNKRGNERHQNERMISRHQARPNKRLRTISKNVSDTSFEFGKSRLFLKTNNKRKHFIYIFPIRSDILTE